MVQTYNVFPNSEDASAFGAQRSYSQTRVEAVGISDEWTMGFRVILPTTLSLFRGKTN
jgi:hypothetical protein